MKDETYSFISDVKEKGTTARSSKSRCTYSRGGKVRFPSDNLSKKELMKMNGECKSFRLNDPMQWHEFKSMPDDLKVTYIKLLRQKFNVPDKHIAEMFGVCKDYVYRQFKALGLGREIKTSHPRWDKEGFYAWVHGVDKLPTPVKEEPVEEPVQKEPEVFVEDDLPFDIVPVEEPDPELAELNKEINLLKAQVDGLQMANDALMASHETDCQVIEKLRLMCSEYEEKAKFLEAQMDVVRMIFGGKNHG